MKAVLCDPCEDGTAARYMVQDMATGEAFACCPDHFAQYCMTTAEDYIDAHTGPTEATDVNSQSPKSGDNGGN
ncbi:MAG: hypothetical protein ACRD0E_07680, partial [Acidimicrobiales bacterium]